MRATLAFSVVLLAAAVPARLGAEEWNKRFNVGAKPSLRVLVDDGRIEVRQGAVSAIEARVVTQGWKIAPEEVRIVERQTGDLVEIEVRLPRVNWSLTGRRWVRVEVLVPPEVSADFRTGDGGIQVTGVSGELNLNTGDGAIEAESIGGRLYAKTGDGRISVRGRFETLDLRTGDGAVFAAIEQGSTMTGPWRVHTGDGSVTVRLPDGFSADLEARTGDGGIHVEVQATTTGSISEHRFRGRLGGGGQPLRIETNDGSIRLERN